MIYNEKEKVYIISHNHISPSFNLACEEYFLCRRNENFILIWQNSPSIIIGRNQNAYAELDMDYVKTNNIPVIRRLTGGGAVFHDLGNLNFTFIKNGCDGLADFREYLTPITHYLRSLGLNADFSGRNDILLDNMKISGNAQTNYRGRVMLHGTLLFSVEMSTLSQALKPSPLKLQAKGIKSVRSRVTNISEHLSSPMSIEEFKDGLFSFLKDCENCEKYSLSPSDEDAISALAQCKYDAFLWNIGNAPPSSAEKTIVLPSGIVNANFSVKNSKIENIAFFGDFFGVKPVSELAEKLCGIDFSPDAVISALAGCETDSYISGMSLDSLINLLFY